MRATCKQKILSPDKKICIDYGSYKFIKKNNLNGSVPCLRSQSRIVCLFKNLLDTSAR